MENLSNIEKAIIAMASVYQSLSRQDVLRLVEATNGISGCSFVSINGYTSDKTDNTELANFVVNIGASYAKMVEKDQVTFENVKLDEVDVNRFDYSTINLAGVPLEDFKIAVKNALPVALAELQGPKEKKDTSADIWLNKALVFNLNTQRLSIFGQKISKTVEIEGEKKLVKSAPKTIAKKIIQNFVQSRSSKLRRFALDNTIGTINLKGETLEIW